MKKSFAILLLLISLTASAQKVGRDVTDFVSKPKLGGYFIGKYSYTSQDGAHGGDGFAQRFTRAYIDGTILTNFKYRIQVQLGNASFHMKDYYLEWARFNEFQVKIGQYKRAFTFENPYNPWDVGFGDYSQVVGKLAGLGDRNGEAASCGGRDQGLQIQGDLFPSGYDQHRYLHYQFQLMNGQGINSGDFNGNKDLLGTLQFQPIKGLWIGAFGWIGKYTSNDITVDRKRWAVSAKLERDGWSGRIEYARSKGYKISDYDKTTDSFTGRDLADGWYATIGIPFTDWLKVYAKYDAYRDRAEFSTMRTMYTVAPNFQLHKNLMFQLQYNYVVDKTTGDDQRYNEIWAEAYVRF